MEESLNNTVKTLLKVTTVAFFGLIFTACGAKKVQKVNIVIPQPPEEPRLFYIDSYRGGSSFSEASAVDLFIGEDTGGSFGNLGKPYGVDAIGETMYVADTAMGVVFVFDRLNKKMSYIGDKSEGKLAMPMGIAHDSNGDIYVSDTKQKKVFGYTSSGQLKFAIGKKNEFRRPTGIALNSKLQRLYVVDTKDHNIKAYSLDGTLLFKFGKRGVEAGEFNFPTNIAIDPRNDNLVVSDTQNFRVQIFDKDGKFIRKFGQIGDRPGMFARSKGIGVDSEGHIYVADAAFNNIQIFDDKGTLLLFFGGHGSSPGKFIQVSGLGIDAQDRLYIVDGMRGVVQMFQYVSQRWKSENPIKYRELKAFKSDKKVEREETKHVPLNIKGQKPIGSKLKKEMLHF